MKFLQSIYQTLISKMLKSYHSQMAKWYRKAAAVHADTVIHTLHRVPKESLSKLRALAAEHSQKAKAIRIGE